MKTPNNMNDVYDEILRQLKPKFLLLIGMLIATFTAGFAIKLALLLSGASISFFEAAGAFLAARVVLFMANPSMPLIDANVKFMSSERILWNLATILVVLILSSLKFLIELITGW